MSFHFDPETREMYGNDFARLFNQENIHWNHNVDNNLTFLKIQEQYFKDKLAARGFLFLNEVYEALGFPWVPDGQRIGWFYADGRMVNLRLTTNNDGSVMIEPNLTRSSVMYFKI